jgi:DNA-binding protein H-NS
MSLNLDGLSPKELDALIAKATQRKEKLAARTPVAEVRRLLAALAKEHGYSLDEVFGESNRTASPAKGSKVAAKYRHPGSGETWSGRGKPPKWLAAEIANGRKAEDFAL